MARRIQVGHRSSDMSIIGLVPDPESAAMVVAWVEALVDLMLRHLEPLFDAVAAVVGGVGGGCW